MMICHFIKFVSLFSILHAQFSFHLVYVFQFLCLFCYIYFLVFFLKPLSSIVEKLLNAYMCSVQFNRSVVSDSATPWIAARQASLSITNSRSSLKLTSIELMMPSSHLILCRPLFLLALNPSQHQSFFQWVNSLHEVAKVLEFRL